MLVVPATFLLVFVLLFATFHSLRQAALVFTGIPFATGGILSLLARGMHFSMSAGVGFIAKLDTTQIYTHVSVRMLKQIHSPPPISGARLEPAPEVPTNTGQHERQKAELLSDLAEEEAEEE